MTIVNHTTGQTETLRAVLREFDITVSVDSPHIGKEHPDFPGRKCRALWSKPPTDAELRTVGRSYRQDTDRPANGQAAPNQLVGDVWVQHWTVPTDDELRARIVAQIKQAASDHILAVLPQWKQSNYLARDAELKEIHNGRPGVEPREWTQAEAAQYAVLRAAWDWIKTVRTASDVAESDVAAMDRTALDAWTMPSLPAWNS